jgi:hypothetical protein
VGTWARLSRLKRMRRAKRLTETRLVEMMSCRGLAPRRRDFFSKTIMAWWKMTLTSMAVSPA